MSKKPQNVDSIKTAGFKFRESCNIIARTYDLHNRLHRVRDKVAVTVLREEIDLPLRESLLDPVYICIQVHDDAGILLKSPQSWGMGPSAWDVVILSTGYTERIEIPKGCSHSYLILPAGWALVERPPISVTSLLYIRMPE